MKIKALSQLKAENASKENEEQTGQSESDDLEALQEDGEELEEQTGQSDDSDDDPDPEEVPAWMQTDDDDSETSSEQTNLMPVKSHIRKRKQLQGEIKAKDDQIADLQQQITQLQQGTAPQPGQQAPTQARPTVKAAPKLSDFADEDDPESAFTAAMLSWSNSQVDARMNQNVQQQQVTARKQAIDTALDDHYERAAVLIEKGNLAAEEYTAADSLMRQTAEQLQPGRGDDIVNTLLANIGAGSEKVVISMGRKASNLNRFFTALKDDPTGIKASVILGKMAAGFEGSKSSKVSSAPAPGKKIAKGSTGGKGGTPTAQERKFLKEYNAAHKVGDRNRAFRARREARKAGVDVTKW